jgi:hypothetical protein
MLISTNNYSNNAQVYEDIINVQKHAINRLHSSHVLNEILEKNFNLTIKLFR